MGVAARISKTDFMIAGSASERLPVVRNGLVKSVPMDGTVVGQQYRNKLDMSQWVLGRSGSQGNFSLNGNASVDINTIVKFPGPFGYDELVWASLSNDTASDGDGGWNYYNTPIDNTKKYRLSVWVRRENVGNGTIYFGCQGGHVSNLGTTTANGNPYFSIFGPTSAGFTDAWVLMIGYIHPHNYTGSSDPTNGIYDITGKRLYGATDFKWTSIATVGGYRAYLFYSTSVNERVYWTRPRMELCDGTESTIQDLLLGMDNNYYPTENVGTTPTIGGIGIEDATVNLHSSQSTFINQRLSSLSFDPLTGEWTLGIDVGNVQSYRGMYYSKSDAILELGEKGTFSFEVYSEEIINIAVDINNYFTNGAATGNDNDITANRVARTGNTVPFKWTKMSVSLELSATAQASIYNRPAIYVNNSFVPNRYTYLKIRNLQFEKKSYPTSYTPTTRDNATLTYAITDVGSSFTIAYKFIPNVSWAKYYTTSFTKYSWSMRDKNTGKNIWLSDWHGGGTVTASTPWIGFDNFVTNAVANWHWHALGAKWDAGLECWFVLTKEGTTWTKYYVTGYGFSSNTITMTDAALTAFTPDLLSFWGEFSAVYSNLNIYNRALTADEVQALIFSRFNMSAQGNMTANISEYPKLPSGTNIIHYPLTDDATTRGGFFPAIEAPTIYERSAAWVGEAQTNSFTYPVTQEYLGGVLRAAGSYYTTIKNTVYSNGQPQSGPLPGCRINVASGASISISGYSNLPIVEIYYKGFTSANVEVFAQRFVNINTDKSGYFSTILSVSGTNLAYVNIGIGCTSPIYVTAPYYVDRIMVVGKVYTPPFMEGTNAANHLEFNLYNDFDLDWSGAWSLVYWKKPMGTTSADLTGYSIESLGCNSNTVGGSYVWWGKTSGYNRLEGATPASFDPNDYFGKWHMVSLVKTGTSLTYTWWGIGGVEYSRTVTFSSAASNAFVTQYGYDLKLGGYDNGNTPNAYFRNLIIGKRAFTNDELKLLAKNDFKPGTVMNIGGILVEGVAL